MRFANFYHWLIIKNFGQIAAPHTLLLKALVASLKEILQENKNAGGNEISGEITISETKILLKAKYKKSPKIRTKANEASETDFFTPKAKKIFTHLQKTFIIVLILYYFNLQYYIWIKMDTSGFAISRVLKQLTLDTFLFN